MAYPSKSLKYVCLNCQTYMKNCEAGCDKSRLFYVCTSFRPPRKGSPKWRMISKVIEQNAVRSPDDKKGMPVLSRSFTRHAHLRKAMPNTSIHWRNRAWLETALKTKR